MASTYPNILTTLDKAMALLMADRRLYAMITDAAGRPASNRLPVTGTSPWIVGPIGDLLSVPMPHELRLFDADTDEHLSSMWIEVQIAPGDMVTVPWPSFTAV